MYRGDMLATAAAIKLPDKSYLMRLGPQVGRWCTCCAPAHPPAALVPWLSRADACFRSKRAVRHLQACRRRGWVGRQRRLEWARSGTVAFLLRCTSMPRFHSLFLFPHMRMICLAETATRRLMPKQHVKRRRTSTRSRTRLWLRATSTTVATRAASTSPSTSARYQTRGSHVARGSSGVAWPRGCSVWRQQWRARARAQRVVWIMCAGARVCVYARTAWNNCAGIGHGGGGGAPGHCGGRRALCRLRPEVSISRAERARAKHNHSTQVDGGARRRFSSEAFLLTQRSGSKSRATPKSLQPCCILPFPALRRRLCVPAPWRCLLLHLPVLLRAVLLRLVPGTGQR